MTRAIFFGTHCDFATQSLCRLTAQGIEVQAIFVPGRPGRGTPFRHVRAKGQAARRNVISLASASSSLLNDPFASADVDHFEVSDLRHPQTRHLLGSYEADIGVSCCFTRRIPLDVASIPRLGLLNVHPSMLPRYRGPDPLFWQFRDGVLDSGVTVHLIDEGLDSGPIVEQESLYIPRGTSGQEIWNRMGDQGAELLVRAIERTVRGDASPRTQTLANGSYQSWPTELDLEIRPEQWLAWRIEHFVRGVRPLGYEPVIIAEGRRLALLDASADRDSPNARSIIVEALDGPVMVETRPVDR